MLVTGFDDRQGCGYVLRTGPHAAEPTPGTQPVRHNGVVVLATPELAAALRDALVRNPVASLGWNGRPGSGRDGPALRASASRWSSPWSRAYFSA